MFVILIFLHVNCPFLSIEIYRVIFKVIGFKIYRKPQQKLEIKIPDPRQAVVRPIHEKFGPELGVST